MVRLSLALTALSFLGFGGWLLVDPHGLGALGVVLSAPTAVAEIRAFYGGLEIGCGVFFALAVGRPAWHTPALVLQAASLGAAAVSRVGGMLVDGAGGRLFMALAVAEACAAALALGLLWRRRHGQAVTRRAGRRASSPSATRRRR